MKKVAIFGGGIAGLSAAHELAQRGFNVSVYEARSYFGGKARSIDVPGSATPGRKPLPGEHGFRFFPGFYTHLFETMREIPFSDGTVHDNLVATSEMFLARSGAAEFRLPAEMPDSFDELNRIFRAMFGGELGFTWRETLKFGQKMWTFLTSCDERRETEFERISWYEFMEADTASEDFKAFLVRGATRSLVPMRAEDSSTRTIATIYVQMLKHLFSPTSVVDSLLNGPTNEQWLDPWVSYLQQLDVDLYTEAPLKEIKCDGSRLTGAVVNHAGADVEIDADYYIAAIPKEVMEQLVTMQLEDAAPTLANLAQLRTSWMNGIQFYLDQDVRLAHGHGLFLDSEWALTSISQAQFWKDVNLSEFGDGRVDGILSICISDWDTPGILHAKPARDCSKEEIRDEVWAQLEAHLNDDDVDELNRANILDYFLDDSILFPNPSTAVNLEPLLINVADTLRFRPYADVGMPNFFLASDYVRTNTDLATMEAANEAAKSAANAILDREGSHASRCAIHKYEEWSFLDAFKIVDRVRFNSGLPNLFDR